MTEMLKSEIVLAARDKIAQGWCQGDFAQDGAGNPVAIASPIARSWCVMGAVYAVEHSTRATEIVRDLDRLVRPKLNCWNDQKRRTKQQVMDLLDELARQLKDAGK